jgi:hypothetical protein
VDFDNKFAYSSILRVQFGQTSGITLYPTPVADMVNIRLEQSFDTDAQWEIIDMMGRILGNGVFAAEQIEQRIPVNTLSEGVYVFRLTDGQKVITQQFRK